MPGPAEPGGRSCAVVAGVEISYLIRSPQAERPWLLSGARFLEDVRSRLTPNVVFVATERGARPGYYVIVSYRNHRELRLMLICHRRALDGIARDQMWGQRAPQGTPKANEREASARIGLQLKARARGIKLDF